MKKIQLLSILCFFAITAIAQLPNTINYQAVARNNAGVALANQTINVRLTILAGLSPWYSETRSVTTNALGLFNVQIGSAGATNIFGTLAGVDWANSTSTAKSMKVELDISNTNLFTDMGTQLLSSVPYAIATGTAIETKNLATRPLDITTTPSIGSKLMWDGNSWTPVRDTVMAFYKNFVSVAAGGGGAAPWVFASTVANLPTITINGNETIIATLTAGLQNGSATNLPCAVDICYQNVSAGVITSFSTGGSLYNDYLLVSNTITPLTAVGAVKLPAGTYRIGMAIKNKSTTGQTISSPTNYVQGVIQVKQ